MNPSSHPRKLFAGALSACALLFSLLPADATISTALQMQLGNPSNATADANNHSHYLIQRTVEAIDFSDSLGEPNWASWDLTGSDIGSSGRSSSFFTDTTLPAGFYEVKTGDYTGSGFDRGHMCPSFDRTDNTTDNDLVFYMSNIIPQTADNNQGVWQNFESYCQTLAQSGNEMLLICGPSSFNGSRIQPSAKVSIPGFTWKIAVVVPAGSGSALSRITTATRVIALEIPNISGIRTTPWSNYVTSVNQLQTDTGFTFFTALPASVATVLRAKVDGAVAPTITSFSPGSGTVGASVTINGTGFSSASAVAFHGTSASFTVNSSTKITATVPGGATSGTITVTAGGGVATSSSSFTVTTGGGSGTVVISQVYGGGGNSGSTYKNDFIELYNAGSTTVDLSTYAVQYASATGSSWQETTLSGSILPGHYYLIQEAAGTGGTTSLPTPEATGTISMSATSAKVALTKTQTLLTVDNPVGSSAVVDFVGYGTADAFEGSGAAPTLSATTSAVRAGGGATDTNNNAADFTAGAVDPRN
ncbi:DNA/RNA non-specific endonuclease [Pedosphaera parvula]|uniref:DNA/RNA non-specific endonuclease n=1 Tax=Pedosphaera parvula (strain Ellin514) TaxID=320771 RepID=B9XCV9_PEDPL|nr:DNA/RNA non-specific endonuclease [Pedosphaera parvula]EEF62305.1 DNA/RNA non-specific endonuclease [Pedosphaera parvula Ellin514]